MALLAQKLGAQDFAKWGPVLLDFFNVSPTAEGSLSIVLIAPNGSRWRVTVDNSGALVTNPA